MSYEEITLPGGFKVAMPSTPKGKRKISSDEYGRYSGYVDGVKFWEFGYNERVAKKWLAFGSLIEANYGVL